LCTVKFNLLFLKISVGYSNDSVVVHAFYDVRQIPYYLDEKNNWSMNLSELQRSIDAARQHCIPRALVVINPGNPTGR